MKTIAMLSGTLVLAGCLATTAGTGPQAPETGRAAEAPAAGTSPSAAPATAPAPSVSRLFDSFTRPDNAKDAFDLQRAQLDLVRPDGAACRVVSDGGVGTNLLALSQIGLTLAAQRFAEGRAYNANAFQSALTGVRPQLKQISRQTLWLPLESEGYVGEQYLKMGDFAPWTPVNPVQRRFVQQTLTPMFLQLKAFAEDDLGSGLKFQMRLYLNVQQTSPEMLPGGILMIPSGMVAMLAGKKDAVQVDEVLAFQLAHEFSHALRRHTTKSVQARLIDGLTIAEVFNKQFRGTRTQLIGLNPSNFAQVFNLGRDSIGQVMGALCTAESVSTAFDQNQELEADTCGALLLDKVGKARRVAFDPLSGLRTYRSWSAAPVGPEPAEPQTRSRVASTPPAASKPPAGMGPFCITPASHPPVEVREAHLGVYVGYLKDGRIPASGKRQGAEAGVVPSRQ